MIRTPLAPSAIAGATVSMIGQDEVNQARYVNERDGYRRVYQERRRPPRHCFHCVNLVILRAIGPIFAMATIVPEGAVSEEQRQSEAEDYCCYCYAERIVYILYFPVFLRVSLYPVLRFL